MTPSRPAGVAARRLVLAAAVSHLVAAGAVHADEATTVGELDEPVVVTGARMTTPLVVETDPKAPRQPLPAHDGADYLKTIPGFATTRKGGTDGDPVFRGMAASRVNMLMDGEMILGGCGMRMDPPTAYVFPAAYDRIVVIKGPQTVLHGPGNSAATVRFDRDPPAFDGPDYALFAHATLAEAARSDLAADLALGSRSYYARLAATRAESDDYRDGAGNDVHSAYERWSANASLGWRPTTRSWIELSGARSDGEAAYADRGMDGVKFDRDNLALRFAVEDLGAVLRRVEGLAFYHYVDHVMDNYSLRDFTPTAMMPFRSVSNPDRRTEGARLAMDFSLPQGFSGTVGVDAQRNVHRLRSTMNETMMPYGAMARVKDGEFENWGLFGEFEKSAGADGKLVAGLRADRWQALDARESLRVGMMGTVPNPTAGEERNETLVSGFARYEHLLADTTLYAGAGYVERFPDYWELLGAGREAVDSLSAFGTRPEKTAQVDVGLLYASGKLSLSLAAFYSDVDDYILIESNYAKGMRVTSISRNVDASTRGVEGDLTYRLAPGWTLNGSLAWTRGENDSDGTPLGQIPPLEARLGLAWERAGWSAGALLRAVASQDRVALNQGNVVGQDIGPSDGFTVFSLNGGYRFSDALGLTAGLDNVFDATYAEHISRAGAMVAGYAQTTRVNEPGRTAWMNLTARF
jgi:iron complex outermembrane receptor protein